MCVFSCYEIPHAKVDGYDVCDNKPKTQAYRAPGATQAAFACEQVIDELAQRLGIDPIEFRLRNAAREGTRRVDGPVYPRVGLVECLQAARDSDHWKAPLRGPHRGRGIAAGFWFNIGGASSCSASVNDDGIVSLVEGSTDIGGSRTGIAMQLAEALGIGAEDVRPVVGDTDVVGYTDVTGGSRVTFATGWAAYEAAQDIKRQLVARAAQIWDVSTDDVTYENGVIQSKKDKAKRFTFKELAEKLHGTGG